MPLFRSSTWLGVTLALFFLVAGVLWSKSKPESWNDIARIATIESLVERGTWSIDDSPWVDETKDKVLLDGHFYSDKMPLLSAAGAGLYAILHRGLGMSLAPDCTSCAYRWLTILLIGVPGAVTILLFFLLGSCLSRPIWAIVLGTVALAFGTMVFPYALVFNHHLPAAAALFSSFYILVSGNQNRIWWAVGGALAGLAISFDILSGIVAFSILAMWLVRKRQGFAYVALGLALPIVITAVLDLQIGRTIVPPYMITNGYSYEGSAFPPTFGGNGTPDDYAAYAFRMFLGGQGLFAYDPILLFALFGAISAALNRETGLRAEAGCAAIGFIALGIYLAVATGNYGGTAYGERWFVPAIPVLFAFIYFAPPLNSLHLRDASWIAFLPVLALGVVSTVQGAQAPWQYVPPPLQMTRQAQLPVLGFKWNLPP